MEKQSASYISCEWLLIGIYYYLFMKLKFVDTHFSCCHIIKLENMWLYCWNNILVEDTQINLIPFSEPHRI